MPFKLCMSSIKLLNFVLVAAGAIETNELYCGHNFLGMKYHEPKVLDLHKAMSVNDLTNHTGHHISVQMTYGETSECEDMLNKDMLETVFILFLEQRIYPHL